VEPGIYLDGETGIRIEDLVSIDAATGRLDYLTRFPREVVVVG
jgi:Xaa-Pro aminopeptidase